MDAFLTFLFSTSSILFERASSDDHKDVYFNSSSDSDEHPPQGNLFDNPYDSETVIPKWSIPEIPAGSRPFPCNNNDQHGCGLLPHISGPLNDDDKFKIIKSCVGTIDTDEFLASQFLTTKESKAIARQKAISARKKKRSTRKKEKEVTTTKKQQEKKKFNYHDCLATVLEAQQNANKPRQTRSSASQS